jgi:MFS family permease
MSVLSTDASKRHNGMLRNLVKSFGNLDQRAKVAMVSNGITSFGTQMTSRYDQVYATSLGANPVDIGVLGSLGAAFSSIIAVPLGWAIERYSVKKVILFDLTLFAIHVAMFSLAGNWLMLIPAYILSTRVLRMGPLADIIFVTVTKPQRRGTVISLSRVVWNVISIFGPITAASIIAYSGGINAQGIRPLYFLQFVSIVSVFLFVAWKLPPTLGRVDGRHRSGSGWTTLLRDYREVLKGEKHLKRWVLLRTIQTFGTSLASPFAMLWLVETKGATPYVIGLMGSISLVLTLILQIPVGRIADRIGRKRVYFATQPMSYVATLLVILAPSPEYLILAGLLGGVATGATNAGISGVGHPLFVTWWWESVPEEKRGRFFGIEGLFGLASIPASILGGILWQQGFMIQVLLFPILLDVFGVLPLLAMVPDIIRSHRPGRMSDDIAKGT